MKFVCKKARRGLLRRQQWIGQVIATPNGKEMFRSSETYNNVGDLIVAFERLQVAAPDAEIVWG
jgi:hypothetical protein